MSPCARAQLQHQRIRPVELVCHNTGSSVVGGVVGVRRCWCHLPACSGGAGIVAGFYRRVSQPHPSSAGHHGACTGMPVARRLERCHPGPSSSPQVWSAYNPEQGGRSSAGFQNQIILWCFRPAGDLTELERPRGLPAGFELLGSVACEDMLLLLSAHAGWGGSTPCTYLCIL